MLGYVERLFGKIQKTKTDPVPVKCTGQVNETKLKVNPNTDNPDYAWDLIKLKQVNKTSVEPISLETPIFENKVRFVCISDTHSRTEKLQYEIPEGDILIHAGDFTQVGSSGCVQKFSNFLETLNDRFVYKIVIAGNHELSFDSHCSHRKKCDNDNTRALLRNCIYLEDSYVKLFGLKIYGSPW